MTNCHSKQGTNEVCQARPLEPNAQPTLNGGHAMRMGNTLIYDCKKTAGALHDKSKTNDRLLRTPSIRTVDQTPGNTY